MTTAAPAKEVRVTGIALDWPGVVARNGTAGSPRWRGRGGSVRHYSVAWVVFGVAYVGAVVFVAVGLDGSVGSVLSDPGRGGPTVGLRERRTIGELGFLRGVWLDGARRLVWLENYVDDLTAVSDDPIRRPG